ncbi:MAG: LptF/LptG family permease [bacterium]
MIKTIHKNIIREVITLFLLTVVCLNFVLMMEKVFRLSRFLSSVGASFLDIMRIIILLQPQILILTVPMSFLIAVLITYGRMNMDSETVVMRAVGMSLRQISLPAAVVGLIACYLTASMTLYFSPLCAGKLRALINDTLKARAPLALEEGVFHTAFKDITVLIGDKPSPDAMRDLFIYDSTMPERPKVITAKSGSILINQQGSPIFDIKDGYINIIRDMTFTELHFARYVLKIDIGLDLQTERRNEKTPLALLREASASGPQARQALYLEFHRRLTLPLINIFIIFLGPALAMHSGKRGRLSGFIYGVGVFGAYYSLLIYFENLARSGALPHIVAWAPLLILGAFSLALYHREARR